MRKISRQDAIYQIALAGISAAVALLFVWLGVLVKYSTAAFFIAASLAIMVPLTKKYWLASFFAYAVSAGLGFVIAGDIVAVSGYIVYFGPMALITGILYNLKAKWYIALPIKVVYINGALALLYFVCHTIIIDASLMSKIKYWVVALVGTILLVAIDFVIQFIYSRLIPVMERVLREKGESEGDTKIYEDDDDPYEDEFFDPEIYTENDRSDSCENENSKEKIPEKQDENVEE